MATVLYGDFEWDEQKAAANLVKHGVSFEEAATVFRDPRMLTLFDDRHSQKEDRWVTLGISAAGRLIVACHTFEGESPESTNVRIISCRKASGSGMPVGRGI